MALANILQAIIAHADAEIARLQEQMMADQKTTSSRNDTLLQEYGEKLQQQAEERKKQLEARSRSALQMERKAQLLGQKRALMDSLYQDVLAALSSQPEENQKKLLNALLGRIKTAKGAIHPAECHAKLIEKLPNFDAKRFTIGKSIDAAGGFIVESDISEENFTYDILLQEELRAKTELAVASELFPS